MIHPTHCVLGTIQTRINGEWHELTIIERIYALDRADAQRRVFAQYECNAWLVDTYAVVRWYNPPLVYEL